MSKIIKVLITIVLMLIILQNTVYAWGWIPIWGTSFSSGGGPDVKIDTSGISIGSTSAISSSKQATENFLGTVQVIGSIISVVALIIIGIRYMASSLEDRANLKGVLIYYVIGAILVFATTNILSVAYGIITSLDS